MTGRPPTAMEFLHDPRLNKGTAFTDAERDALGLRGLLPPRVVTPEEQEARVLENFRNKPSPLEQYIYLISLQDRNERLFYRTVMSHVDEMMPIIYTPTVGQACLQFGHLFRRARGLYITARDRGRVREILGHWPESEVGIIVVTDGERILGLGDLGANGMGIPIGKLSLYTACAGVDPALTLPVTLDVGTDREELLRDPLYLGIDSRRLRGEEYDGLVEEFITAVEAVFPGAIVQFEDFATGNALRLLSRYRDRLPCFNDDIQGTAAVVLAALLSAGRVTGQRLVDQRILFLGAGAAAAGIAHLLSTAMQRDGLPEADARRRVVFFDQHGLLTVDRPDLAEHQRPYAHAGPPISDLLPAIDQFRPTTLIGVSTQGKAFTEPAIRLMARINQRPIIFPLSNPTSRSECTAEEAYAWTGGQALFASGSPFGAVELGGVTLVPRQCNNAYIFPGVGLGVIAARARRVTDSMFYAAACTLAEQTDQTELARGALLPPLAEIRRVSAAIAVAVARLAHDEGIAGSPRPADLVQAVTALMYQPTYPHWA